MQRSLGVFGAQDVALLFVHPYSDGDDEKYEDASKHQSRQEIEH